MKLAIHLIFVTIQAFKLPKCTLYNCYTSKYNNQCAKMDKVNESTVYSLSGCPEDKICDFHPEHELSYCKDSLSIRYPGEYCKNTNDCITKHCIKNECVGLRQDDKCTADWECGYKLYCNKSQKRCIEVNIMGQNCDETVKCDSGLICDGTKCVVIGSLDIGESTMSPFACKTLYSYKQICAPAPKLITNKEVKGPIECSEKCKYESKNKNNEFEIPCKCGKEETEQHYCNPGIGDIDIRDVS